VQAGWDSVTDNVSDAAHEAGGKVRRQVKAFGGKAKDGGRRLWQRAKDLLRFR
jgi:hypothetical protein